MASTSASASASRISSIRNLYDKRAPAYDHDDASSDFHRSQAVDFVQWMSLTTGLNVLDLACGTGGITIPTAKAVGATGIVIGVDISLASLSIAKGKAEKESLENVKFFEHDIASLQEMKEIEDGFFDIITCASAFVLLENPKEAVLQWAKFLKRGGKIIFDVPTPKTMIWGYILDKVGLQLGAFVPYSRAASDSLETVTRLLTDAGLDASGTFMSKDYTEKEEVLETEGEKAGLLWDKLVRNRNWFENWYTELFDGDMKAKARDIFVRELQSMAGESGRIEEELRFYIAVGKKV